MEKRGQLKPLSSGKNWGKILVLLNERCFTPVYTGNHRQSRKFRENIDIEREPEQFQRVKP